MQGGINSDCVHRVIDVGDGEPQNASKPRKTAIQSIPNIGRCMTLSNQFSKVFCFDQGKNQTTVFPSENGMM
jgi:hypothetical protein